MSSPENRGNVQVSRQQILSGLLVGTALLAAAVIFEVIWTVFFAVTVAYILVPLHSWLKDRGLPSWWASVVASLTGTSILLFVVSLTGFLVYRRRQPIIEFVTTLSDTYEITLFGMTYAIETERALQSGLAALSGYAVSVARALPTLALKLTVFAFVVFGLLSAHERVEEALLAAIPDPYHDVSRNFAGRIREILYSLYVLQLATGAGTFLIALPVFSLLGYDIPVTLSFIAGVLQFLPIIGPSVLIVTLALYQLALGDVVAALLLLVIGGVLVAWLPDVLIRPRLAGWTSHLSGTLYYVGFVGGLLTVGAIGIIAGPLAVGLVAEALALIRQEAR